MSHDLVNELVSDLLDIDDIMLSVNSGRGFVKLDLREDCRFV